MEHVLVDTGFLVALGRARDPCHRGALRYLASNTHPMVTVSAVVVEACHFLGLESRQALLHWLATDGPGVVEVPVSSYPDLSRTMERHSDRQVDFADAALVWLAEHSGHRRIVTVDRADFSLFRLKGGKKFELIDWS